MKAIALGDKIFIEAENETDNATIKLVTRTFFIALSSTGIENRANSVSIESLTIRSAEPPKPKKGKNRDAKGK